MLATLAGAELALVYAGQRIELGVGVAAAQRFFAGLATADVTRSMPAPRVADPERVR